MFKVHESSLETISQNFYLGMIDSTVHVMTNYLQAKLVSSDRETNWISLDFSRQNAVAEHSSTVHLEAPQLCSHNYLFISSLMNA